MGFSYSKVSCHNECAYKYYLRYKEKLEVKPDQRPDNALYLGSACHEGIEKRSVEAAIDLYKSNYSALDEGNELEIYKLRTILPKAIKEIPEGEYEYKLLSDDGFIGFIDELVLNEDGTYTMYDYKYSNQDYNYRRSGQLHIYKYYFERLTGKKIKDMYYILIPKATHSLRESITEELSSRELTYLPIEFDPKQVSFFFARKALMDRSDKNNEYDKRYSTKCAWCEYQQFCKSKGEDLSELTDESALKWKEKNSDKYEEVQLF